MNLPSHTTSWLQTSLQHSVAHRRPELALLPAVVHSFICSVSTCQLHAVPCAGGWERKGVKRLVLVLR